jgi:antitoxin StbD
MRKESNIKSVLNSLVPITRFNRGEANKIFDEVNEDNEKYVLKNNTPVCVLVKPKHYEAIIEALEDYALFFEAEKRVDEVKDSYISTEQVLADLGIGEADLADFEVEIE